MIKVFIVDDHQVLIDGIKFILDGKEEISIVGEALDGEMALAKMKNIEIDVVLLDINLPKKDGIETCKALLKMKPDVKVIGLTMFNEGSFIQNMLKSGARGYILKHEGKEEMIKAIKSVYAGEEYLSQEVSKTLIQSMITGKDRPNSNFIPKLTRREREILALILEEHTTAEIAGKLFLSLSTIETHRKNLLSKFGVRNTAGLVRFTVEHKLLER